MVVVTVPVSAFPNVPAAPLAGKTVIDTCNYGPERDGNIPELDDKSLTSSELLLRYIPDGTHVKAFNNIFFKHLLSLARPAGAADRSYLPIAGDSAPAKEAVTRITSWRDCLRTNQRSPVKRKYYETLGRPT
jgi:predicted dinucleotide-binding enzyme